MKRWIPFIIIGLFVLGLHLPKYFLQKHIERDRASNIKAENYKPGALRDDILQHLSSPPANGTINASIPHAADLGTTYTNVDLGFSITFPSDWSIEDPISDDVVVNAIRYGEGDYLSTIRVHAYVMTNFDNNPFNLDSTTPEQIFNVKYGQQGGRLIDSGIEYISGRRAIWMKYKTTLMDDYLYVITYMFLDDNILYTLDGDSFPGDLSWFTNNLPALLESFRSFKFQ